MTQSHDDETSWEERVNDAFAEYLRCADREGETDIDEFLKKHADIAAELKGLLETAGLIQRMAGPQFGDESSTPLDSERDCETGESAKASGSVKSALAETALFDKDSTADSEDAVRAFPRSAKGRSFGDYEILDVIGQGGMGVVYKARQVSLNRMVALKMIRSGFLASESDIARFHSEAQTAGKLSHPNVIQVHQVGECDGQHFFSMEFIDGTDLSQLIHHEALEPERIARYLKAIAETVQHAHEHHVIHRDLKPANIIIDVDDRPLIGDFGLAKDIDRDTGLTASGVSLGTPAYMSPEQAAGKTTELGPATDIYSLGAILYEMLTGRPPFQEESRVDLILAVIHKETIPPRTVNPAADKQLEAICLKCLNKDPKKRYTTASDLAEDIERFLASDRVLARRTSRALRCWQWCRDVPVVGALIGRRVTNPSAAHKTAQWLALLSVGLVLTAFLRGFRTERASPPRVRIGTAIVSGEYHEFGRVFGTLLKERLPVSVEVLTTNGAGENRELLIDDEIEVALLQASAIRSDPLAIVAPLYHEYLYFIARTDRNLVTIQDLGKKAVVVGKDGSGMQLSAIRALQRLEISVEPVKDSFPELNAHKEWDAAIVTAGPLHPALRLRMSSSQFRLLPLTDEEQELLTVGPVFRPGSIKAGSLGSSKDGGRIIPADDVRSVTTTTFLVVHKAASSEFVTKLLETLYGNNELQDTFELVPREVVAQWPALPFHPAASKFFESKKKTAP
jgi:eukaryotic-like serine/threonine-protein kinase